MDRKDTMYQRQIELKNKSNNGYFNFRINKNTIKGFTVPSKQIVTGFNDIKDYEFIFNGVSGMNEFFNLISCNGEDKEFDHWSKIKYLKLSLSKKFIHTLEKLKKNSLSKYEELISKWKENKTLAIDKNFCFVSIPNNKGFKFNLRVISSENRMKKIKISYVTAFQILELWETKCSLQRKELIEQNENKITINKLGFEKTINFLRSLKISNWSLLDYFSFAKYFSFNKKLLVTPDYKEQTDNFNNKDGPDENNTAVLDDNVNIIW